MGLLGWLRVLISIHALLAESDLIEFRKLLNPGNFYPRSPCGERPPIMVRQPTPTRFLSTLSLRRATVGTVRELQCILDFYPRSPCGERQSLTTYFDISSIISIHALLAESDNVRSVRKGTAGNFYPRSPCGERLLPFDKIVNADIISIHALLAESDFACWYIKEMTANISIHALLAESDTAFLAARVSSLDFYPRSPCGERPSSVNMRLSDWYFYPRSPCGERQNGCKRYDSGYFISIHALLAESDEDLEPSTTRKLTFLSTLSLRRAT